MPADYNYGRNKIYHGIYTFPILFADKLKLQANIKRFLMLLISPAVEYSCPWASATMLDLSVFDTFFDSIGVFVIFKELSKVNHNISQASLASSFLIRDVKTKPALRFIILYSICTSAYLAHIHTRCLGVKNSVLYSHGDELKRNNYYCTNCNMNPYKKKCCGGNALSVSTNQIQLPSPICGTSVFTSYTRTRLFGSDET